MRAWGDVHGRYVCARLRWVFVRERDGLHAHQIQFACAMMCGLCASTIKFVSKPPQSEVLCALVRENTQANEVFSFTPDTVCVRARKSLGARVGGCA